VATPASFYEKPLKNSTDRLFRREMWKLRILVSLVTVSELKDLMVDQKHRRIDSTSVLVTDRQDSGAYIILFECQKPPLVKNIPFLREFLVTT